MKTLRKSFILVSLLAGAAFYSPSAQAGPVSLLNFQVSGIGVFAGTASSFFVHGAWTPQVSLGVLGIRGEIGVTSYDFGPPGGRFVATNYDLYLQLALVPTVTIEGGVGEYFWHGQAQNGLGITGNLVFTAVPGLHRVFAGYTRFTAGGGFNIVKAGIGFDI